MNAPIAIRSTAIAGQVVQSVNARDLHEYLEIGKDFSSWIKSQLADVFLQEVDFSVFTLKGGNDGRSRIEYALTIECAKHIAMMSRSEKGRSVRSYFIECERRASSLHALPNFNDPVAAARAWADAKESEQKALIQLEAAKPAIEFVDRFVASDGNKGFREVCKLLKANEAEFREFLIDKQVLYRLAGRLTPYAQHLDAGRFEVKAGIADNEKSYTQAKFTPKGVAWVAGIWMAHGLAKGSA